MIDFSAPINPNEEVPERCTEKLVDLVFVLATKLDLNVNDMRELLDTSLKEHTIKFETITNQVNDNFQNLNNEIEKLKLENKAQNDTIAEMKENHGRAVANHDKLQADFTKLNDDYQNRVVQDHGDRVKTAETNIAKLEESLAKLKKDTIKDFENSIKKIESMEIDLLNKMEAHGKSQNTKWLKHNQETEDKMNKTIENVNVRLDDHDVRLLKLNEETHQHRADFLRYKEDNDNVINEIKDALAR